MNNIPLFSSPVYAGFPSPADDFIESNLDLNSHLIEHPSATFFVTVRGDSMINAGIFEHDILIVDRAVEARDKSVIVAILDGEFVVKRFKKFGNQIFLLPENPKYKMTKITEDSNFEIWGVVTTVIHKP